MKFYGCTDGGDPREFEGRDADDAAEAVARDEYELSGEVPRGSVYKVNVISLGGEITRHTVALEWSPVFSARAADGRPSADIEGELRAALASGGVS